MRRKFNNDVNLKIMNEILKQFFFIKDQIFRTTKYVSLDNSWKKI